MTTAEHKLVVNTLSLPQVFNLMASDLVHHRQDMTRIIQSKSLKANNNTHEPMNM
jgi:hypothetical protein